jgi:hypothetical protein
VLYHGSFHSFSFSPIVQYKALHAEAELCFFGTYVRKPHGSKKTLFGCLDD